MSLFLYWMIDWFYGVSTLFQLSHSTQCKYPCYVRDYFTRIPHIIVSEQLAASSHSQHGNNGEWGMNPVAMTIINPRERNWPRIDWTNNLLLSSPVYYHVLHEPGLFMNETQTSTSMFVFTDHSQENCLFWSFTKQPWLCTLFQKTKFWTCPYWMNLQTTKQMWLKNWNLSP